MASQNDQYTNQARQVLQNSQELVRRPPTPQMDVGRAYQAAMGCSRWAARVVQEKSPIRIGVVRAMA